MNTADNIPESKILVLALGNEIMGDDAAGLIAARILRKSYKDKVDVLEAHSAGFMLLDILEGYDKVLLLDTVYSQNKSFNSIREMDKNELSKSLSVSPHYVGLPELIKLSERLEMKFPQDIKALVIEIHETGVLREGLSNEVNAIIPDFVERASDILNVWLKKKFIKDSILKGQVIY